MAYNKRTCNGRSSMARPGKSNVAKMLLRGALCASTIPVPAATVVDCSIERHHERYQIDFHATLNVSAADSYAVIADVANFPRIDSTVRQVRVLSRENDHTLRLEIEAYLCVLRYCKSIHEVQDMIYVQYPIGGDVVANVLPQFSDFRYGRTEWQMSSAGGQTLLHVVAELEPAFDAPPVIGPWLIKHVLRAEAERTAQGIEQLAQRQQKTTAVSTSGRPD